MALQYQEVTRLASGHTEGVACVAFNHDGSLLATGGLDSRLCVWCVKTNKLLHSVSGSSRILSLLWDPAHHRLSEFGIHFGTQDGCIGSITISENQLSLSGFSAHEYPIERLTLSPKRIVASGAHSEVKVWELEATDQWNMLKEIEQPHSPSADWELEVLATGLHWTKSETHPEGLLIVSYMYHGILIVDASNWCTVRTIPPPTGCIADSALSNDGLLFAVSNLVAGFDIYDVKDDFVISSVATKTFRHELGGCEPAPVRFVHGGLALLTGSAIGEPRLWSIDYRSYQSLHVGKNRKVLAIAAHHELNPCDEDGDEFLIATCIVNPRTENSSTVVLWRAGKMNFPKRNTTQDRDRMHMDYFTISSVAQAFVLFAAALYLLHAAGIY